MADQMALLEELQENLKPYLRMLGDASEMILTQEVSRYPIFIIHSQPVDIGLPLWDHESAGGDYSISASSLEEFVTKQLIQMEKVDDFIRIYKKPKDYFCLFFITTQQAQFIFLKRHK